VEPCLLWSFASLEGWEDGSHFPIGAPSCRHSMMAFVALESTFRRLRPLLDVGGHCLSPCGRYLLTSLLRRRVSHGPAFTLIHIPLNCSLLLHHLPLNLDWEVVVRNWIWGPLQKLFRLSSMSTTVVVFSIAHLVGGVVVATKSIWLC
jgi:hypothetical protein